ncbi:MAG: Na(+)-translocating NADH-quinone reductase subunit A [Rikenellaceae bacterium]
MSSVITIKKGLDIKLQGEAEKTLAKAAMASSYAICPDQYIGVTPKLLVKAEDTVKVGTPLFFDKSNPEILFTSPVSGTVKEIQRGEKRKILSVVITPDGEMSSETFAVKPIAETSVEEIKELMLKSGLWPSLIQRPFGLIANPQETPRDIYVSALDTAPLAVDVNFILQNQRESFQAGLDALSKLTSGEVHLSIGSDVSTGTLSQVKGAAIHSFAGKHPAGLVGTQIAMTKPIAKGETVWTIEPQHVVMIGKLMLSGKVDFEKIVALAGSQFKKNHYVRVISHAAIDSVASGVEDNSRLINGNPLSGRKIDKGGYVGFYGNAICAIPEGDYFEFVGWAMPRFKKFSASRGYFSWLTPKKKYDLDTNINGGERAFVMNGIYEDVTPMDIYPVYLLKAVMAGDIDKMENLGIYEVIEEDLALCEFICPSKIEWQQTLRDGITKMIKEL